MVTIPDSQRSDTRAVAVVGIHLGVEFNDKYTPSCKLVQRRSKTSYTMLLVCRKPSSASAVLEKFGGNDHWLLGAQIDCVAA